MLSRRTLLGSLAASPVLTITAVPAGAVDAKLIALGEQFDAITAQIDHADEHRSEVAESTLDELSRIEAEIVATPATTIDGLRAKARAVCWARLGDFDPANNSAGGKRMALSIVRDLIRLYDAPLERPGALAQLIEECTKDSCSRAPAG